MGRFTRAFAMLLVAGMLAAVVAAAPGEPPPLAAGRWPLVVPACVRPSAPPASHLTHRPLAPLTTLQWLPCP